MPGKAPVVSVINSTITDFADLEETIENLLGSDVVYQENEAGDAAVGYIPQPQGSVVESLLNKTVGIDHLSIDATTKTNIVNIFIINILEKSQEKSTAEFNPNEFPAVIFSPNAPNVVPPRFVFPPMIETTTTTTEAPHGVPIPNEENFQSLLNVLMDLQESPFGTDETTPPGVIIKDSHLTMTKPESETSKIQVPERAENPHGLNLNENTILDLLPNFVRHTTIPPVVPLNNFSLHEQIGKKPSVLGLLPNQLFSLANPMYDRQTNSTRGGIIRKPANIPSLANIRPQINPESYFSARNPEPLPETLKLPRTGLISDLQNLPVDAPEEINFLNDDSASPLQTTENRVSLPMPDVDTKEHKPEEPAIIEVPKPAEPSAPSSQLLDFLQVSANKNVDADDLKAHIEEITKGTAGNDASNFPTRFNFNRNGKTDKIMKAVAIGAVPSGLAFATALFPYWAPLVFGKKRRKRDLGSFREERLDWIPFRRNKKQKSSSLSELITKHNPFNRLKFRNPIEWAQEKGIFQLPSFTVSSSETELIKPESKVSENQNKAILPSKTRVEFVPPRDKDRNTMNHISLEHWDAINKITNQIKEDSAPDPTVTNNDTLMTTFTIQPEDSFPTSAPKTTTELPIDLGSTVFSSESVHNDSFNHISSVQVTNNTLVDIDLTILKQLYHTKPPTVTPLVTDSSSLATDGDASYETISSVPDFTTTTSTELTTVPFSFSETVQTPNESSSDGSVPTDFEGETTTLSWTSSSSFELPEVESSTINYVEELDETTTNPIVDSTSSVVDDELILTTTSAELAFTNNETNSKVMTTQPPDGYIIVVNNNGYMNGTLTSGDLQQFFLYLFNNFTGVFEDSTTTSSTTTTPSSISYVSGDLNVEEYKNKTTNQQDLFGNVDDHDALNVIHPSILHDLKYE